MTSARANTGAAAVSAADDSAHRMLAVGGMDAREIPLDSCELYDAAADRWSMQEALLRQPMRCHAAPIAGGSAVLAVQWDHSEKTHCALFDLRSSSPSWQPVTSAPSARAYHSIAAVGEYSVVIFGGEDVGGYETDTALLYDARADRWSERAEWRLPAPAVGHCTAVIE